MEQPFLDALLAVDTLEERVKTLHIDTNQRPCFEETVICYFWHLKNALFAFSNLKDRVTEVIRQNEDDYSEIRRLVSIEFVGIQTDYEESLIVNQPYEAEAVRF